MHEEPIEQSPKSFLEKVKQYKIHLSLTAAVLIVGVSAAAHYKNGLVKEKLVQGIEEYQKSLMVVGGEINYSSVDCSGIFSTDCEIEGIKLAFLGQEQLSVGSLRIGNVEELEAFKELSEGKAIKASIDIEADDVALPKVLLAQLVTQNISNAFQQTTLEKLNSINLELKGELEGDTTLMKQIVIDRFTIDNAIMPIRFSMKAREVSSSTPDSMVLDQFSMSAENRALSDVTYGSVKSFVDFLKPEEKGIFLKEFGLTAEEMGNKEKASSAINLAMAKRFEADLAETKGIVEKELTRAIIKILKAEATEIVLKGENKNELSMAQIQNALVQSSSMSEEAAQKFMEDKFTLTVEAD